jgi:hypothetical protein
VSTVTRTLLVTGAILTGVAAAAAQAPGPRRAFLLTERPLASVAGPGRSPADVIERLASFDGDLDRRISRDELPERMQGLVARGDRNADGALDVDEIRALLNAAPAPTRLSFRPQSAEGLPGVIRDLKLSPEKHLRALVIVGPHKPPRSANDPASSPLLEEMKALLDDQEYESFLAAATRLSRGAERFRIVGGVVGSVPPPPRPR